MADITWVFLIIKTIIIIIFIIIIISYIIISAILARLEAYISYKMILENSFAEYI